MPSRRQFLATVGAAAVGTAATTGIATADHDELQPEHVTIDFPESKIQQYAPELVLSSDARDKLIDVYGWRARSPEYDTTIYVYWASYTHQEGWLGNRDSHLGDHEPIQVIVDDETEAVQSIRASVYHWIKGEALASEFALTDNTHPRLRVIDPWHQYTAVDPGRGGFVPDVVDLRGEWDAWLSNGLEESVVVGASRNPWVLGRRESWWQLSSTFGISKDLIIVNVARDIGIGTEGSLRI